MLIPNFVILEMMYRDGCNYKTSKDFHVTNEKNLTEEYISKILNRFLLINEDGVIANYYDLPSLAPVDNEFISAQGDDHSFTEFTGYHFSKGPTDNEHDTDISEILHLMKSPELVAEKRKEALAEAIKQTQKQLTELNEMKL